MPEFAGIKLLTHFQQNFPCLSFISIFLAITHLSNKV